MRLNEVQRFPEPDLVTALGMVYNQSLSLTILYCSKKNIFIMSIEANNFMILVEAQAEKYGLAATFKENSIVTADGETEAAKAAKEEAAERDAVKVGLNTKESSGADADAAAAAAVEGSDLISAFSRLGISLDITEELLAKWDGLPGIVIDDGLSQDITEELVAKDGLPGIVIDDDSDEDPTPVTVFVDEYFRLPPINQVICYMYWIFIKTEGKKGWCRDNAGSMSHFRFFNSMGNYIGTRSCFRHRALKMNDLALKLVDVDLIPPLLYSSMKYENAIAPARF